MTQESSTTSWAVGASAPTAFRSLFGAVTCVAVLFLATLVYLAWISSVEPLFDSTIQVVATGSMLLTAAAAIGGAYFAIKHSSRTAEALSENITADEETLSASAQVIEYLERRPYKDRPYKELGDFLDSLVRKYHIHEPYAIAAHLEKVTGYKVSPQIVRSYLYGESLPEPEVFSAFAEAFSLSIQERRVLAWRYDQVVKDSLKL